jgi:hypothetical protein
VLCGLCCATRPSLRPFSGLLVASTSVSHHAFTCSVVPADFMCPCPRAGAHVQQQYGAQLSPSKAETKVATLLMPLCAFNAARSPRKCAALRQKLTRMRCMIRSAVSLL